MSELAASDAPKSLQAAETPTLESRPCSDENGNGTVDFDEFCDLMTRNSGGLQSTSNDVVDGVEQIQALGSDVHEEAH